MTTPRLAALLMLLAAAAPTRGQDPPPAFQGRVFRAETEVVLLDVVVRDKKGRTVRDLRADEVEVIEDGVKQEITSFRLLDAAAPGRATQPTATPAEAEGRYVNLVTLVFDQLGTDGRRLARQAALDLLKLEDRPDLFLSVFQMSDSLRLLQQFTAEREPLREAVKRATGDVNTQYTSATDELVRASAEADEARRRLEGAAQSVGAAGPGAVAQLSVEAAMATMTLNALRMTQTLQREQQGRSSLFALLALAKQQQPLAGRKTIIFFAEGLQTPPTLEHVLKAAISEANRANVSIYAVDARGLLTSNALAASGEALRQAANASLQQQMDGSGRAVTREEVMIADTAESSLRMDVQGALADLAVSTGGALIGNTNDMRTGLERALQDLSGYYELVYSPTNREYDGHFRKVALKVSRPGVTVQTRTGYFALPPGEGTASFPFELALLKALRATPPPQELPFRARAFRFGYEQGRLRHTLVLELPLGNVAFEGAEKGQDRAHFSFMGVLRDAAGGVAAKFSQDLPVSVPHDRLAALRQGNALFIRSFTLAPGRYTLETAALDEQAERQGVRKAVVVVPPPQAEPRLALSSLSLVKRTEPVAAGALESDDPFRFGATRIIPHVGEPDVASGDAVSLFLVAYAAGTARADLALEFVHDGTVVARSEAELPAPDAQGRIPYVATVPGARFAAGRYEVRAEVRQAGQTAQESAFFRVAAAAQ
jgi:VWFA-related protein